MKLKDVILNMLTNEYVSIKEVDDNGFLVNQENMLVGKIFLSKSLNHDVLRISADGCLPHCVEITVFMSPGESYE